MNKTCARCEKTVYPTEELKCLDKTWHKGCFKCQECGMTLNMRTYKGYGKLPYCEAHVPKAKPTTMAETPELKRIAENTKLQSNVNYHADFERSKGKFTQVADDPETLRIKANTRIISNVAYHGDLEKKAHMERQRQAYDNGELLDTPADSFHQQLDSYASEMLSPHQQQQQAPHLPPKNHYAAPAQPYNNNRHKEHYKQEQYYKQEQQQQTQQQQYYRQPQQKYDDYYQQQSQQYHKYEEYPNQNANQYRYGAAGPAGAPVPSGVPMVPSGPPVVPLGAPTGAQHKIGRIQDYDPLSDGPRPAPHTQRPAATLIYNSTSDHRAGSQQHQQQQQQQQQSRPAGRAPEPEPPAHAAHSAVPPPPANHHNQRVYIAMYDYEANDSDEVSFREGDLISNVTSIDEGWMTGQVLRTGRTGMLPANYVELAH